MQRSQERRSNHLSEQRLQWIPEPPLHTLQPPTSPQEPPTLLLTPSRRGLLNTPRVSLQGLPGNAPNLNHMPLLLQHHRCALTHHKINSITQFCGVGLDRACPSQQFRFCATQLSACPDQSSVVVSKLRAVIALLCYVILLFHRSRLSHAYSCPLPLPLESAVALCSRAVSIFAGKHV